MHLKLYFSGDGSSTILYPWQEFEKGVFFCDPGKQGHGSPIRRKLFWMEDPPRIACHAMLYYALKSTHAMVLVCVHVLLSVCLFVHLRTANCMPGRPII